MRETLLRSETHPPRTRPSHAIEVVTLLIVFSWLGYAFYKGPTSSDQTLLHHPLIALLLIPLIQHGLRVTESRPVWWIASALLGIWLFLRLRSVLMPFLIGFTLAYFVYLMADFFNSLAVQMTAIPLLQPMPDSRGYRWRQALLARLHLLEPSSESQRAAPVARRLQRLCEGLVRLRLAHRRGDVFYLSLGTARFLLLAVGIGVVLFFAFYVGPQMGEQSVRMKDGLVVFYGKASDFLVQELDKIQRGEYAIPAWVPESLRELVEQAASEIAQAADAYLRERIPDIARRGSEFAAIVVNGLSTVLTSAVGTVATGFLALMVFAYAITGFREYMRKFLTLFPESYRPVIRLYLVEIDTNMRVFLRGQLLVIALVSLLSMVVYGIIGVPFAVLVGLLAGLCNAIPTFGPYIGGAFAVLALLMGLASGSYSFTVFVGKLVMTLAGMFGVQMIDNSLISPRVMSSAVDVDPLLIMFSVIVGASLIGFWGVLLAIPVIVVVKSILQVSRELQRQQVRQ